jgi:hypothetical protein
MALENREIRRLSPQTQASPLMRGCQNQEFPRMCDTLAAG